MHIVLLGDVGILDDMIHIGDEAMFEEFASQLRRRDATDILSLSSNPAETASRYGVSAVPSIGFHPASFAASGADVRPLQEERMRRVIEAASGDAAALSDGDPAWEVIDAVRSADAVAVSGGGNMASIWPMHIFERATLAALARVFAKPFVVSGQTIGPELVGDDRRLVAELLGSARLVGLRERASLALVHDLGVSGPGVVATIDDASFLADGDGDDGDDDAVAAPPYCSVTLAAHVGDSDRDAFAAGMARLLDRIADETGLEIVFFAHFSALGGGDERGDSLAHRRVIDRMTRPSRIERTTDSAAAARFARGASLSVSSRYHPAVFAVAAGVPTIGIAVDDYTTVKLTGALGNFGQTGVVRASDVIDGSAADRAVEVWQTRDSIRAAWAARIESVRAASVAWWDSVARALAGR
ncbi:polysaccharide pyruvyl transferase WcaK-like protein [Frondihabitans sp. PhB188]|uniref:polysaccharide pyruvyl transferase family protein n=1 Tax=Frondihabitans sp. PhB188 TaxID=2485200 RepID=UPI000F4644C8|nr:polysaccharide pyruvyl transferase family protein [Frondihabitans sp. PhB188]ROQ36569.1 polysaccharide pyruvyl transferase WcaK-like protein [Frondihabitans sp. PhB188]